MAVTQAIPPHCGLGSGTQMALALAAGIRALEGLPPDTRNDAALLGRGHRSGLGAAFMTGGGLAVDGGKGTSRSPPPIVAHHAFPRVWRVILVLDPDVEGFHGEEEIAAFAGLPDFPESAIDEICRLVLMQVLPAIAENDIAGFGAAITVIQQRVGGHFASAQGGLFASRRVARTCKALASAGAHGIGQSSWGPTGFAFAPSAAAAATLVEAVTRDGLAEDVSIRIVAGRNHGAAIERSTRREKRPRTG